MTEGALGTGGTGLVGGPEDGRGRKGPAAEDGLAILFLRGAESDLHCPRGGFVHSIPPCGAQSGACTTA